MTALPVYLNRTAVALEAVNLAIGKATRWLVLAMLAVQAGNVLMRYVFGTTNMMAFDAVIYMHATVFMLGAGYTLARDAHVRVDIIYAKLNARGQALINLIGSVAFLAPSVIVFLLTTWSNVANSWAILEGAINVGGIPAAFLLKSLLPAFLILVGIQGVALALRSLAQLLAPPREAGP